MKKQNKLIKKGFTLVEMLVVIAIIGVVSSIIYVSYNKYVGTAKITSVKAELLEIVDVFETEMVNNSTQNLGVGITPSSTTYTNYEEFQHIVKQNDYDASNLYYELTDVLLGAGAALFYKDGVYSYINKGVFVSYDVEGKQFIYAQLYKGEDINTLIHLD